MNTGRLISMACCQLISINILAQRIDNTASFRIPDGDKYVRLHYENDFFTATDYYYSQGINIEYAHPVLRRLPLSKLLLYSSKQTTHYGVAIEHNAFTPTSIRHEAVIYGDRPFAATLCFKTFSMFSNSQKRLRISSALYTGILGPAAGGEWLQKSIHKWLNNIEPLGWQHQIKNNVLLNYEVNYEKNVLCFKNNFLLNALGEIRAGTYNDNLTIGTIIMMGRINRKIQAAFSSDEIIAPAIERKKFNFHFYLKAVVNAVGYDASVQGAVIGDKSPYLIPAYQLERITFRGDGGLVVSYQWLYLEYFQSYLTKEFKTGLQHRWGGVVIGIRI